MKRPYLDFPHQRPLGLEVRGGPGASLLLLLVKQLELAPSPGLNDRRGHVGGRQVLQVLPAGPRRHGDELVGLVDSIFGIDDWNGEKLLVLCHLNLVVCLLQYM